MLDEIKYRYRAMSIGLRLTIIAVIALIPGALSYIDNAPLLEEELEIARSQEATARQNLATAKSQVKNLSAMEEKLAFTTDQLAKAENLLPGKVNADEVVQQIGKSAKESDVYIRLVTPMGEKTIGGDYPYDEVRYKVTMGGKFPKLVNWMDSMSGYDSKAYLKSWQFSRSTERASRRQSYPPSAEAPQDLNIKVSASDQAKKDRDDYQLDLKTEIVYYRVASARPINTQALQTATSSTPAEKAPPTSPMQAGIGGPQPQLPNSEVNAQNLQKMLPPQAAPLINAVTTPATH